MHVVVDVSVIGLAQLFETARTGIFRVISGLVPELLATTGCEISFTSLSSTEVNLLVDAFFQESGRGNRYIGRNRVENSLFTLAKNLEGADRKKILQRLVARLFRSSRVSAVVRQADVFHSTFAPLPDGMDPRPLSFLTVYDMIPVLHPEYFWKDFDLEFQRILSSINVGRDRILTISRSSKDDVCNYLKIDPEMVHVAYPAADSRLYHPEMDREKMERILRKYNIPADGYYLSLATLEYRKNLRSTIDAFRMLLQESNRSDQYLVLVGARGWKIDQLFAEIAEDPLLKERVICPGYVADEDLSGLYSAAVAFVYPSLYEGFGLPPLEAMQCGLPVITSNTSSLPEVVGEAGIMVSPTDTEGLAQAMLNIREDSSLRRSLVEQGLEQAARFSWSKCARETVAAYRHAFQATSQ